MAIGQFDLRSPSRGSGRMLNDRSEAGMMIGRIRGGLIGTTLVALATIAAGDRAARGQLPDPLPPLPAAPTPPTVEPPGTATVEQLLKRLDKLEAANKKLQDQNEALAKQYKDLSKKVDKDAADDDSDGGGGSAGGGGGGGSTGSQLTSAANVRPARAAQVIGNRKLGSIPLKASYDYRRNGFQFQTDDGELQLKFRAEAQADARVYDPANQFPVNGGFYLPRTRFYFQGRVTRPIEYQISFQQGYGTFAPLNVYLNFHYDDRFQLRFGRYKAPWSYEFYHLNNWRLIQPERSLFNTNFQLNRQIGLMGWGELFEKRMEYAAGIFDGPRNSFQDFNGAKDIVAFLNFRPFERSEGSFLQNLNFGGSVDYGYQDNPLNPLALRTSASHSNNTIPDQGVTDTAAVPFLAFNNGVRERGLRELWDLHLAYYYGGLSLLGSWSSGIESWSRSRGATPTKVPLSGYYVQAAYLLTGETITDRTLIDPLRPFDLRKGKFGIGAWELTARYSELELGQEVFNAGLSDPNLWSRQAQLVDVGLNWYLNQYVKIYFDWEHAMFGSPVFLGPGPKLQSTNDLFWCRFQVYF
jgi:phosphate-selective porin OprO/OprP